MEGIFMKTMYDCYELSNGVQIPCLGYGTYKAANNQSADIILTAIEAGYRFFDTASFYETEAYLAEAIERSKIKREEFFITSKVWKSEMGYEETLEAFSRTLSHLKTDYLDLYLIHWPRYELENEAWEQVCIDTWKALETLYQEGKVRAIGLSNFLPHHIELILKHCTIQPMVNQLEFHPGYTQEAAVNYCKNHQILVQAWSPLGRMRVMNHPTIIELSNKYHVSAAQLCLRFALQKGINIIPKSSTKERMLENQDIFNFEIEVSDMYRLDTLPQTGWSGEHPDFERVMLNDSK